MHAVLDGDDFALVGKIQAVEATAGHWVGCFSTSVARERRSTRTIPYHPATNRKRPSALAATPFGSGRAPGGRNVSTMPVAGSTRINAPVSLAVAYATPSGVTAMSLRNPTSGVGLG
jgi:hypothetical protein